MSSWYSSWFPGLPTFDFAVPSSIQRRFISFLLRRTLGQFLKPGQLDLHQIDSQLGSGTVQVKDLELDGQAINKSLVGLPFSLYDGFISGVTARVPFPNPLSSSVGFHVQSLSLTLQVTPEHSPSLFPPSLHNSSNLANSVASVAETFIHNELTPREEAALRQTMNSPEPSSPPVDESDSLPGGFKPFGYRFPSEEGGRQPRGDDDPAGVSVVASLIERLLAKFEFSAADTKVTIIYPGRASFTLYISEITYHTGPDPLAERDGELRSASGEECNSGPIRTIKISGLKVTSRDLRVVASSPAVLSSSSPVSFTSSRNSSPPRYVPSTGPLSRTSSSSSLDEHTSLLMSQSIAMLPSNFPPLSSTSASMYQSAISTAYPQDANVDSTLISPSIPHINTRKTSPRVRSRVAAPCQDSAEDVLLSFGAQPIVLSLKTPYRKQVPLATDDDPVSPKDFVCDEPGQETFQLSVNVGTLACAFLSDHLRLLLDTVDACVSSFPLVSSNKVSPDHPRAAAAFCLEANIIIRGIVMVVLPGSARGEVFSLDTFYERPLVPPRLPSTYLRLFLDAPSIFFRFSTSLPDRSVARFVVSDVSLFAFHAVYSSDDLQVAAPVMIFDHYLPTLRVARHYRLAHASEKPKDIRLPDFEVPDWTQAKFKGGSAKLSTWRIRNRAVSRKTDKPVTPSQRHSDLPNSPNPFIHSPSSDVEDKLPVPPVIEVSCQLVALIAPAVDLKIAPIHLFLDLGMILKDNLLLRFFEDVASATIFTTKKEMGIPRKRPAKLGEDNMVMEQGVHPLSSFEREAERKRLEAIVLGDLSLDAGDQHTVTPDFKYSLQNSKQKKPASGFNFRLTCPMIRVEVRCPPPPPQLPRSGCMLFDIHDMRISNDPPFIARSIKILEGTGPSLRRTDNIPNVIMSIHLQEILAAYSLVGDDMAHSIFTLASLPNMDPGPDTSVLLATETVPDMSPLAIMLGRPSDAKSSTSSSSSKLSMTVDIPLVNLVLDKAVFDGLQFWADDVTQLIERSLTAPDNTTETLLSRNPSLIGSRYFTQTRRSRSHNTDESVSEQPNDGYAGQSVVKLSITEVLLRFIVPRDGISCQARPVDVSASNVDVLVELKPEGRDETLITAEVMDLSIADTSFEGNYLHIVQSPTRSLSLAPRPSLRCKWISYIIPGATAKESQIKLSLWGFAMQPPVDGGFGVELIAFTKAPPGVFESVVPSECTRLTVGVADVSVHVRTMRHAGAMVLHLGEAEFSTDLVGTSSESAFTLSISSSRIFLVDSIEDALKSTGADQSFPGRAIDIWKSSGYALIAEISRSQFALRVDNVILPPSITVTIDKIGLQIYMCADTMSALTSLVASITQTPANDTDVGRIRMTSRTSEITDRRNDMTASLDEHAFRLIPEVGNTADMISDDLPANQDYLDVSFGTAAGLRELRDDDLEDFNMEEQTGCDTPVVGQLGIVSNIGGETVRILRPFSFIEHYFDTISVDVDRASDSHNDTSLRIRIHDSDVVLFLHDGFDWLRTRKIIEKEVKEMRKKLARIRQLVATGQTPEPINEATSATLFNSFHIGIERDLESMDQDALIAAIDDELDDTIETGTESSWQSLHPSSPSRPRTVSARVHGKRLTRSRGPSVEIRLEGLNAEIDNYRPGDTLVSRTLISVRDLEILDHIKTSTWKKFLTGMRSDSRGNVRETDSNMVRVELLNVRPSQLHPVEEARLRAKLLPLRLYVDQDAVDFFKKFFAFQDSDNSSMTEESRKKNDEIYFQHAEVFPVDIKLDYKPRRVDYRALRDGRTIELMNFFHFDGAEMTLRHLTLHGITGWPRLFDTLNDLWTPDVKATQLVDVISGVAPIRSVVNVGSGVADLVLLPIAQYKKDGRIVRGIQKGTKAFVQSTAMEAIKLGARLATGTQVILEQAENVLGGQFKDSITAEALQIPYESEYDEGSDEDLISRYAAQPASLKEGVRSAYHSLQRNLHSAAQTILAVPMEVYERSGNEGAVSAVVRAVPIAVLKPMIGASEAVSKTLMGLHNTLDPNVRLENEAKYKHH